MYIYTIDIAHPPMTAQQAEQALSETLTMVRSSTEFRVLKVIHGKGTPDRPAVLKEVVLNWTYKHRNRLRTIIAGENYEIIFPETLEMRKECGQVADQDLGAGNEGMTIVWIK